MCLWQIHKKKSDSPGTAQHPFVWTEDGSCAATTNGLFIDIFDTDTEDRICSLVFTVYIFSSYYIPVYNYIYISEYLIRQPKKKKKKTDAPSRFKFSPRNKFLVSWYTHKTGALAQKNEPDNVIIWELATGKVHHSFHMGRLYGKACPLIWSDNELICARLLASGVEVIYTHTRTQTAQLQRIPPLKTKVKWYENQK